MHYEELKMVNKSPVRVYESLRGHHQLCAQLSFFFFLVFSDKVSL